MTTASRKLSSILLITLFTLYYVNITLFPHTHHVGGVVIVHSHVYTGVTADGEPRHSHTRTWLIIISDLSLFLTTAIILVSLSTGIIPSASYRYSLTVVKQPLCLERKLFQPRAPPVVI